MPKSLQEIREDLVNVDRVVEQIAVRQPEGSDLSILAHAIQNLVLAVENMVEYVG